MYSVIAESHPVKASTDPLREHQPTICLEGVLDWIKLSSVGFYKHQTRPQTDQLPLLLGSSPDLGFCRL